MTNENGKPRTGPMNGLVRWLLSYPLPRWLFNLLRWPQTDCNGLRPWWAIAWALLWIVPLAVSVCVTVGLVFMAFGASSARRAWMDLS